MIKNIVKTAIWTIKWKFDIMNMLGGLWAAQLFLVMKHFALDRQKYQGDSGGYQFCAHDGKPNAINIPDEGEEKNSGHLEQQ